MMVSHSESLRGIYAITDAHLIAEGLLNQAVESVLQGGARLIQYRRKGAPESIRLTEAITLSALCTRYSAKLIINDDVDLCLASEAHGVHLGRSDGDIQTARDRLGPGRILGVTCHDNLDYALDCMKLGVDYCAFGRLFPSHTKPDAPQCSLDILRQAVALGIPSVGIGGITTENLSIVKATGAQMAAIIHDIFSHNDITHQTNTLVKQFQL